MLIFNQFCTDINRLAGALAYHPNLSTANGDRSILAGCSLTSSLTRRPVPAPRLSPSIEWPVATITLLNFFILPI